MSSSMDKDVAQRAQDTGTYEMKLFVDNKSTIDLANHHICHGQSRNIKRMCNF